MLSGFIDRVGGGRLESFVNVAPTPRPRSSFLSREEAEPFPKKGICLHLQPFYGETLSTHKKGTQNGSFVNTIVETVPLTLSSME